jgi:hypothetical protein
MLNKSHSKTKQHEAADPAPKPIEQPPAPPTNPSRADRLEAAINEIEALVGDKYPISHAVQDVIKRAKSD